ncbi:hypothetical protein OV203_27915 [Nannocystis sp. ILAH1]|uniref:hypothetical protein n=1 Tax=Nannocystis sp. ILAH1 TaxID=2996789 RepID=UPI00226DB946|nr:hypothetical protein [Nannocystis sp. ILAH1]MCY0991003.1 hypothetical protein [Nannocystis sp. ILAH1]
MNATDLPELLLVDADEHVPALDRGAALVAADERATQELPDFLWDENAAAGDLVEQRWAVLAPEGPEGDALLAAVDPLISARAEQQGVPVRIYRVPPRLRAEEAARWRKGVFQASERDPRDLPRYQLILGDLHAVSAELQALQATDGFVGRLAFDSRADYVAYVDKVLSHEQGPPGQVAKAIFHTVHDGTGATTIGHRALVEPAIELAREMQGRRRAAFPAEICVSGDVDDPRRDDLLRDAAAGGVLFSVSHGEGAPRRGWQSLAEQRARQGAMSFGPDGRLGADELAGATFLPGGLWFMLACFGAGTPDTSKYRRWLEVLQAQGQFHGRPEVVLGSLPRAGEPPFVAALPKAALASPRGPLGFIGHVDLAWTYSFRELDAGKPTNRPQRFVHTLASALRGDRLGVAFHALFRFFAQTNTELTTLDEDEVADPTRRAHLWMLRNDLAGYVLLGDPAARLPIAAPAPVQAAPRGLSEQASDLLGFRVTQADEPAPAEPALATIEAAIGHLLAGTGPLEEVARRHGLDSHTLTDLLARYRRGGRAAIGRG